MEEGLLKASMPGFWGGENSDWSPHALLPNQCVSIINAVVDPSGQLVSRGGTKKITSAQPSPGQPILSGFKYYDPTTGARTRIIQAGKKLFTLTDAGVATPLLVSGRNLKSGVPLRWGQAFATGICLFSGGKLNSYDGTTAVALASENMPEHISRWCENLDRVFCVSNDEPNHVYRSPSQSVTDAWDTTDYSPFKVIRGDRVKDLVAMSNWVMVFKERSIHRLDGSTIYDTAKSVLSQELGLLGNTAGGYRGTAIWLSPEGVIFYNEAGDDPFVNISENRVNSAILAPSESMLDQAVGCFYPKKRLYLLAIPYISNNTIFVFDLKTRNPAGGLAFPCTRWQMPFAVSAIWTEDGVSDGGALYFGSTDGHVYRGDYGASDDGVNIAGSFQTAFSTLLNAKGDELPDRIKNVRRLILEAQINGTASLQLVGDFGQSYWPTDGTSLQATSTFADSGALVWGVGKWGVGKWGKAYVPMQEITVSKFNASRLSLKMSWSSKERVTVSPPTVMYFPRDARVRP